MRTTEGKWYLTKCWHHEASFLLPSRAQLSAKSHSLRLLGGAEPGMGGARMLHSFHALTPRSLRTFLTPTLSLQKSRPASLPFALKSHSVLEIYCILIKLPSGKHITKLPLFSIM